MSFVTRKIEQHWAHALGWNTNNSGSWAQKISLTSIAFMVVMAEGVKCFPRTLTAWCRCCLAFKPPCWCLTVLPFSCAVSPSLIYPHTHTLNLSSPPNAHASCVLDLTRWKMLQRQHLTAVFMSAFLTQFIYFPGPNYSPLQPLPVPHPHIGYDLHYIMSTCSPVV